MTAENGNGRHDVSENLRDRLVKLMRKAESAKAIGSQAEAEAFAAKVSELCLKHKIELGSLNLEERDRTEPVGDTAHDFGRFHHGKRTGRVATSRNDFHGRLTSVVARAHCCRIYYSGPSVCVVGRAEDRATVIELARQLIEFAERQAEKDYCTWFYANGARCVQPNYKKTWFTGFTEAIQKRLKATREAVENQARLEGRSTALIVYDDRAVEAYLAKLKLRPGRARKGFRSSADGRAAGYAAGQRAALHKRLG